MRRRLTYRYLLIVFALVIQNGCSQDKFEHKEERVLTFPGETSQFDDLGAVTSFDVFVGSDNKIHLAVDTDASRYYLYSEDGGGHWSTPLKVASGKSNSKQGNDIQIAASQDKLLMVWKGQSELPGWGAAQLAVSTDRGQNWRRVESPAKGDLMQNQGYFSLAADEKGFHFFWLDDREEEGNTQGLRYAHSSNGVEWGADETIETGLCTCCWVSTTLTDTKLHALYRDEGPRDMKLVTRDLDSNRWQPSVRVGAFNWDFIGCPHQGGALTQSVDGRLHSVVWTGKEKIAGLHYLLSSDQGASWQYQYSLSGGEGQHVDLASQAGNILIAWDSQSAQGNIIQLTLKDKNDSVKKLSMSSEGFAYPRVTESGDNFRLFWTDLDKMGKKRLKTTKVKQINRKVK
ncbi:MAG: exo-alpha-sialidase [Gammaproteobacteria bacterium]|nr:MAG: exo-alpha-sialidase [Gammaproteobacteria bacterium]